MRKLLLLLLILAGIVFVLSKYWGVLQEKAGKYTISTDEKTDNLSDEGGIQTDHPLTIASLRNGDFPGSEIIIEQTLDAGSNYSRYIASYLSEGNKIYALLTVPNGDRPKTGWPVILFNHGFIPPAEYRTTERYISYVDGFARNGYIVFRSDYRGHGSSEGTASGGYGSNAYTIDILNAVASVKKLKDPSSDDSQSIIIADKDRIGMWGHSMGGHITLRSMVATKDIKAGVIWAGVVASYPDLVNNWRRSTVTPSPLPSGARRWRQLLVEQFGEPDENAPFWQSISSNAFLSDISGPVQLHHGTADHSVPYAFSQKLDGQMKAAKKEVEYYEYSGDDHNLTVSYGIAMERSIAFFDKYLK